MSPRRTLSVSPTVFHRLAVVSLAFVALIVLTGGAVRLTGSGLGCSNWPECSAGHLSPALHFHSWVEFGNRLVTVLITVLAAVTLVASILRSPRRRDLVWLSVGLVGGILAQAVIGGIVVYTKLNPYLVQLHFFASMLLVADAVVLVHRSTRAYAPGSGRPLVPRPVIRLFYGLLALLAVVIAAGTATTGAGPHAGESSGQEVAKRIPVALRDMAEVHSTLALLLVGVTVGLVVALQSADVPERVRRSGRILLVVMVAQAAVGYAQYFSHLPALLVELHLAGVTALVVGMVQTFLVCTHHPPEVLTAPVGGGAVAHGVTVGATQAGGAFGATQAGGAFGAT